MRSKISIAIGFAAVAAIAFVGFRPTEVKADIGTVKDALRKQKKVHTVTVNGQNKIVREAWVTEGKLIVKMKDTVEVKHLPLTVERGAITVEGVPLHDHLIEVPVDELLEFNIPVPAPHNLDPNIEFEWIELPADQQQEKQKEFSGRVFVVNDRAKSNVRRIFATDEKTKLPLEIRLQQKKGQKWESVLTTKFDYTKAVPKEVLKSAGK